MTSLSARLALLLSVLCAQIAGPARATAAEIGLPELRRDCFNDADIGNWRLQVAACLIMLELDLSADDAATAQFKLAYALDELNEQDAALSALNKAIELNPVYHDAHVNRGLIYRRRGETGRAIAAYTRALEVDPDSFSAYLNRGYAYYTADDYPAALADLTDAIRLRPEEFTAYHNRGLTLRQLERLEDALADFRTVMKLAPDEMPSRKYYAITLVDLGRAEEGLAACRAVLSVEPDWTSGHRVIHHLLARGPDSLRDYVPAIQHGRAYLELEPDDYRFADSLAVTLTRAGRVQDAISLYRRVLDDVPELQEHYIRKLVELGFLQEASTTWDGRADLALEACVRSGCEPFGGG